MPTGAGGRRSGTQIPHLISVAIRNYRSLELGMDLPKRILIVEDSATQAMRLQHLLKSAGIDSHVAPGGQAVLDLFESDTAWDAILSDIDMPEIDGFELCKRVKQLPAGRSIPFVILVSLKDMRDVVRSLESGADNMLMKEYDKTYFLPQLATICSEARTAREAAQKCTVQFEDRQIEVEAPPSKLAAMLVSTFAMAVHQKAAKLPVAGKA
jgi:PleD family two-component response regulator